MFVLECDVMESLCPGTEGIIALATHPRKDMPWSITLTLAECMWVPSYDCLHRTVAVTQTQVCTHTYRKL